MSTRDDEPVSRAELEALLATRRELGPDYEAELVASFTERVEHALAQRSRADVEQVRGSARDEEEARKRQFVLGLVSLGVGVPITIVPVTSTGGEGLTATVAAWVGIIGVNLAHGLSVRARRRR